MKRRSSDDSDEASSVKKSKGEDGKEGKSLMELLELELRARAIKALLNKNPTVKYYFKSIFRLG